MAKKKTKKNSNPPTPAPSVASPPTIADDKTPELSAQASPIVETNEARFHVVGIVASAGGLDAFTKFFTAMPADSGIAFVLVP